VNGMRGGRAAAAGTLAVVTVLAPASTAHAADVGSGYVTHFDVDVEVRPSGVLDVHESITYVFDGSGHGILRSIPYRYRWDNAYDRETEIGPVTVISATAPVEVEATQEDGQLVLRIGDADRLVSGSHTYQLDYTVAGALSDGGDHVELAWNGVGDQWSTRIASARLAVRAPGLLSARCVHGPVGSDTSCGTSPPDGVPVEDGLAIAAFGPEALLPYEAMTVYADLPAGTVRVTPPVLVERWSPQRAFSVTPATVGVAAGLLALGLWAVRRLARRGRDEQAIGGPGGADVPVDWRALRDMRPGLVGTLVDEKADVVDVTATIVDLAVRRHLRIEELTGEGWVRGDWRLVRLQGAADDLLPYEQELLDELFLDDSEVRISHLEETFHEQMSAIRREFYEEVVERGWYRVRPDRTRVLWYGIGVAAVAVAAGVAALLVAFTTWGLVGVAVVIPALALLGAARAMPARTVEGSAALQQVAALRRYLTTTSPAAGARGDTEETFSSLLPYAMVLGLERRWTQAFAPLAAAGRDVAHGYVPYWYVGTPATLGASGLGDFGDRLSAFSSTAGSAMTSSPSSSSESGGGWSGGGSSGGGGGGGGGGGW
jgi:uncharacterized membrane protein YgcG